MDNQKNLLTDEFGEFAKAQLEDWKVPGISLAIIDGQDIFAQGYGFAALPDTPATPETVWYAGSTTKAHLAALIAHLIDSKEYPQLAKGWSTTLSSLIRDDFVLQDEWATAHLTLEDAVCHRTGFGAYENTSIREVDGRLATVKDLVRTFRHLPSWYEPRTNFLYCNLMYVALSHAIETVTGEPLDTTLRKVIWRPLDMNSTHLTLEGAKSTGKFASHYYYDDKAGDFKYVPPMPLHEVSGAGASMSSAVDFAKWVRCLINETKPFSDAVHKDIRKPRMFARPASSITDISLYGLGWERTTYKGHVLYKHGGGVHAGGSQIMWLPDIKFGAVAFGNTAITSNAAENVLLYRLVDEKLGISESERTDVGPMFKEFIESSQAEVGNLGKVVYGEDFPDTPLPATFTTTELVGTYLDPAWGKLTFREEHNPKKAGEMLLVADRPEMTWRWQMVVSHASGDFWVATIANQLNPTLDDEHVPAKFNRGLDGKVGELVVEWVNTETRELRCKAIFKRTG